MRITHDLELTARLCCRANQELRDERFNNLKQAMQAQGAGIDFELSMRRWLELGFGRHKTLLRKDHSADDNQEVSYTKDIRKGNWGR